MHRCRLGMPAIGPHSRKRRSAVGWPSGRTPVFAEPRLPVERLSAGAERAEGKTEVTIGRQDVLGCVLAALAVGFLAASPLHVAAQPAFFQGKQVRFYTMGSPGGGYDTHMRALIPHLERKL